MNQSSNGAAVLKKTQDIKLVAGIAAETIRAVYPHYYPAGAVDFFLWLHSTERVKAGLESEEPYLLFRENMVLGTGSIRGNEICRLFILPEQQGRGYGKRLMDLLEEKVFLEADTVCVDASFPAERLYLNRGYRILSYETIQTDNGDFLCYHRMEKRKEPHD